MLGGGLPGQQVEGYPLMDRLVVCGYVGADRLVPSRKAMSKTQWRKCSIYQWLRTTCMGFRAAAGKPETKEYVSNVTWSPRSSMGFEQDQAVPQSSFAFGK